MRTINLLKNWRRKLKNTSSAQNSRQRQTQEKREMEKQINKLKSNLIEAQTEKSNLAQQLKKYDGKIIKLKLARRIFFNFYGCTKISRISGIFYSVLKQK